MRRIGFALAFVLAVFCGGCGPLASLHPLWDDEHVVAEPKLIGTWVSEDLEILKISQHGDLKYFVTLATEDGVSRYETRAVRLDGRLYLDFFPDAENLEKLLAAQAYLPLLPTHFFARVTVSGDTLEIALLDEEVPERLIERGETGIPAPLKWHDGQVLTAETGRIQMLISRFADTEEFWSDLTLFRRIGTPD